MERGKLFTPEDGVLYENRGGGQFRCLHGYLGNAVMVNIKSGWTFKANGIVRYADGKIEWDYSTGGHFVESLKEI